MRTVISRCRCPAMVTDVPMLTRQMSYGFLWSEALHCIKPTISWEHMGRPTASCRFRLSDKSSYTSDALQASFLPRILMVTPMVTDMICVQLKGTVC